MTARSAHCETFEEFFVMAEPRLRRALVAAYGVERGVEGTAEALSYGWEHWDRVRAMSNPIGYLYRVGQSKSRPRRRPVFPYAPSEGAPPWVEPRLPAALKMLSRKQRLAVVLVHGFDWQMREVAELIGISPTSVQNHLERGLRKLRRALEVDSDVNSTI